MSVVYAIEKKVDHAKCELNCCMNSHIVICNEEFHSIKSKIYLFQTQINSQQIKIDEMSLGKVN